MGDGVIELFRPFVDTEKALALLRETLTPDASGRLYIGEGKRVAELERQFGALVGSPDNLPLAVNSCTSALALALHLVADDPNRNVVISTPLTCTATSSAIIQSGAEIVWADVDPITGLIDPADVARKMTERVRAVVAVDWAGRLCDYPALRKAVGSVPIIRDAAHSLLAEGPGVWEADWHCWSVGPIKHLSSPDGGFLLAPPAERQRARLNRWFGLDRETSADFRCEQTIETHGFKYHQNDVTACILLANIGHVAGIIGRHRANAAFYDRVFRGLPGITVPPPDPGSSSWLYYLLADDRGWFMRYMAEQGIATSPVHARNDSHPAYHFPSGPLPGVDHIAEHGVAIPTGWWVDQAQRETVAAAVIGWASRVQVAA